MARQLVQLRLDLPIVANNRNTKEWLDAFSIIANNTKKILFLDTVFNPASVAANNTSEQSVTVTGVDTTDFVWAIKPSHTAGVSIGNVRVTATDTVAITFVNSTAGSIDPPSETYKFLVIKV